MPPEEITVELYGTLADIAGARKVTVEARTLGDIYRALAELYPEMEEQLEGNVSASIDGRIYAEGLVEPVTAKSEVVLLPRIRGG